MADIAVVTNSGLGILTNRIMGSGTEPKYIGWGTGATEPAATDTGLQAAATEARATGSSARTTTTVTNDTYQVSGALTCAGSSKTITEVATFDASTGGNICVRGTFAGILLNVGDSIQFTIKIPLTQAQGG